MADELVFGQNVNTEDVYAWMDQPGDRGYNWEDLGPKIMALPPDKDEFDFIIKREREDGMSFSAEAVEALARGCMTFFLSRAKAHWEQNGTAAQKAKITIRVELEE